MAGLRGFDRMAGRVCGAIVAKEIEVVLKIWANTSKMLAKCCCDIVQRANIVSKDFKAG